MTTNYNKMTKNELVKALEAIANDPDTQLAKDHKTIQELTAEILRFKNSHKIVSQEKDDLSARSQRFEDKCDKLSSRVSELERDLAQEKAAYAGLGKSLTKSATDKIALEKQVKEAEEEIKDLQDRLDEVGETLETEKKNLLEIAEKHSDKANALEEELASVTKWNSRHNMKVAAAVVGAIVLIGGVAYLVKRFLLSGEVEIENLENGEIGLADAELSVVNY